MGEEVSEQERKRNKETKKKTKKQSYQSGDILFPDFRVVSYLRVDICGVSKLTGMPVGLYCLPQWTQYDKFRNVTLYKTLKADADNIT